MQSAPPEDKVAAPRPGRWLLTCLPLVACAAAWPLVSRANRPVDISVPNPPLPAPNGFDDFDEAARLASVVRRRPVERNRAPFEPAAEYLRAAAEEAEPVVAAVRRGLAKPYRHAPVRSFAPGAMPDYSSYRAAARVVAGAAAHSYRSYRPVEAADLLLDCAHFGVAIASGGPLIADLVGLACEAIALPHLEAVLLALPPSDMAHVAERLGTITAARVGYGDVVMEEAWAATAWFVAQLSHARTLRQQIDLAGSVARPLPGCEEMTARHALDTVAVALADKRRGVNEFLRYCGVVAEQSAVPYAGTSPPRIPRNAMARLALANGAVTNVRRQHVALEAATAVLQVEVALLRHEADAGAYPADLAALVPRYLPSVPADPFGAQADPYLRYRCERAGHDFTLYSLGANLTDDGGTPQASPASLEGDIVAGRLWDGKPLMWDLSD